MKIKFLNSEDRKTAKHSDEIVALQRGNSSAISKLYDAYCREFISFACGSFNVNRDTAADIYQESFIALHQNIQSGKLTNFSVSLKSYLFHIGKHKLMNHHRHLSTHRHEEIGDLHFNIAHCESQDWLRKQEITYEAVLRMTEPCNTVLTLYYWEKQSMADIARRMEYKNEQVAVNRKSLCMKKLKQYLTTLFKAEGLTVKTDEDEEI